MTTISVLERDGRVLMNVANEHGSLQLVLDDPIVVFEDLRSAIIETKADVRRPDRRRFRPLRNRVDL